MDLPRMLCTYCFLLILLLTTTAKSFHISQSNGYNHVVKRDTSLPSKVALEIFQRIKGMKQHISELVNKIKSIKPIKKKNPLRKKENSKVKVWAHDLLSDKSYSQESEEMTSSIDTGRTSKDIATTTTPMTTSDNFDGSAASETLFSRKGPEKHCAPKFSEYTDARVAEVLSTTIPMTMSNTLDTGRKRSITIMDDNQPIAEETTTASTKKNVVPTLSMDTHERMPHDTAAIEIVPAATTKATVNILDRSTTNNKRSTTANEDAPNVEGETAESTMKHLGPTSSTDTGIKVTKVLPTTIPVTFDSSITEKKCSTIMNDNQRSAEEAFAEIVPTTTTATMSTVDAFGGTTANKKRSTITDGDRLSSTVVATSSPGRTLAPLSVKDAQRWTSHGAAAIENFPITTPIATPDIFDSFTTSEKRKTTMNDKQPSAEEVTASSTGMNLASVSRMDTHGWLLQQDSTRENFPTAIPTATSVILDSFVRNNKPSTITNQNQPFAEQSIDTNTGINLAPTSDMDTQEWSLHGSTVEENIPTTIPTTTSDILDSSIRSNNPSTITNQNQPFAKQVTATNPKINLASTQEMGTRGWSLHGSTVKENIPTTSPTTTSDILDSSIRSNNLSTITNQNQPFAKQITATNPKINLASVQEMGTRGWSLHGSTVTENIPTTIPTATSDILDSFIRSNNPSMITNQNQPFAKQITATNPKINLASAQEMGTRGWSLHGSTVKENISTTIPTTTSDILDSSIRSNNPSTITNQNQLFAKQITATNPKINLASLQEMGTRGWSLHGSTVTENIPTTIPTATSDILDSFIRSNNLSTITNQNQPFAKQITATNPKINLASVQEMGTRGWSLHGSTVTENIPTTIPTATADILDSFIRSNNPSTITSQSQPIAKQSTNISPGINLVPASEMGTHGWLLHDSTVQENFPTTIPTTTPDIWDSFIRRNKTLTIMDRNQPFAKRLTDSSPGINLSPMSSMGINRLVQREAKGGWHGATGTDDYLTIVPISIADIFDTSTGSKKLSTSTTSMMAPYSFDTSTSTNEISTIPKVPTPITKIPSTNRNFLTIWSVCFHPSNPCGWDQSAISKL